MGQLLMRGLRAWDSGAAAPAARLLTTAFVQTLNGPLPAHPSATVLRLWAVLSVVGVTGLHVHLRAFRPGSAVNPAGIGEPLSSGAVPGVREYRASEHRLRFAGATLGLVCLDIPIDPGTSYEVWARREGGDATSAVIISADLLEASAGDRAQGGGGGSDRPVVLVGPTSVVDDGGAPPAHVAITNAYATYPGAGAYQDLDPACTDLALIMDTFHTTPTSIELEVQWSTELAAAPPGSNFYDPAVNTVSGAREQLGPIEYSFVGRTGAVLPNGSYRHVIERPPEALSYRVRAKMTGGAADTAIQVWARQEAR